MSTKNLKTLLIAIAVIAAIAVFIKYWYVFLALAVIALVVYIILKKKGVDFSEYFLDKKKKNTKQSYTPKKTHENRSPSNNANAANYSVKSGLMTNCEKEYFEAIKTAVGTDYIVQPQVNLATIIDKESTSKYRNELFRNVDFGVFNQDYSPIVLIEINDATHNLDERKARDSKVKQICDSANVPLITFWTKYGVNQEYITKRIAEYLPKKEITSQAAASEESATANV